MNRSANVCDRRSFLGRVGLSTVALAASSAGGAMRDGRARRALAINGNLAAPLDPLQPIDPTTAAMIRDTGLSAFKLTAGGSDADFAATEAELNDLDRAISLNPALLAKVTTVGEIEAAREGGRIGVILSFEAAGMIGDQIDRIDHFRTRGVRVMGLSYNAGSPFGSGVMSRAPPAA